MIHLKKVSRDRQCDGPDAGGEVKHLFTFSEMQKGPTVAFCWGRGPTPSSAGRGQASTSGPQKWLSRNNNNTNTSSPKSLEHLHPHTIVHPFTLTPPHPNHWEVLRRGTIRPQSWPSPVSCRVCMFEPGTWELQEIERGPPGSIFLYLF